MSETQVRPEVREIVGAILLVSRQPVTVERLAQVFQQAADHGGGLAREYAEVGRAEIEAALAEISRALDAARIGLRLVEVAHGRRLESLPACGPWVRVHLERGRPQRLSQPALETLAIVAYRQPVTRAEIEAVRGVAVDQILRNLLDLQLIRVVGRSDLPGRPWLFGTTQRFLEHFGLNSLDDLPGVDELRRRERSAPQAPAATAPAPPAAPDDPPAGGGDPS